MKGGASGTKAVGPPKEEADYIREKNLSGLSKRPDWNRDSCYHTDSKNGSFTTYNPASGVGVGGTVAQEGKKSVLH